MAPRRERICKTFGWPQTSDRSEACPSLPVALRSTFRPALRERTRPLILRRVTEAVVTVVVEIPGGSRNKYEMDHDSGLVYLDRMLFTATRYPADYGFIDGTMGEDGDPLDALVFVGEPTFPGCRILARPIGNFGMRDEKGQDDKILCVPLHDPDWSHVEDLEDLRPTLRNEIEHFFSVYKNLEAKKVETQGFADRGAALAIIERALQRASAEP
jgi:inorganic pyrophosphatase